jgi:hypothetical protein
LTSDGLFFYLFDGQINFNQRGGDMLNATREDLKEALVDVAGQTRRSVLGQYDSGNALDVERYLVKRGKAVEVWPKDNEWSSDSVVKVDLVERGRIMMSNSKLMALGCDRNGLRAGAFTRAQRRHRRGDGWTPRKARRLANKRVRRKLID